MAIISSSIAQRGMPQLSRYTLLMRLAPGTRLGPYRIVAPLGAGGMGEVYRAHDERLERDVAIKVLPPELGSSAEALARFEREAKAIAALSDPRDPSGSTQKQLS
jgi:serine/threonine protein kinase